MLFRDLTYIFVAAVMGGILARWLRLPLILGFVAGGIAISPFTPGPQLGDVHSFEVLADVGVALLMFSIGFEFSFRDLVRVRKIALIGGPIGIVSILGISIGISKMLGWSVAQGAVIGASISVASTMVMAGLLSASGRLNTEYGRVMIGITLVEDLAVVCITAVLPALGGSEASFSQAAWTLGRAFVLLLPLTFLAIRVIPGILRRAKNSGSAELFLLVAIAICLGTAALAQAAGLSTALGAFLAGLSISGSDDLHQAHAQLVPLRDAFVALFFVSLGTLLEPRAIAGSLPLLGIMLALIIAGKFMVWSAVMMLFRYSLATTVAVAAGLTQIGELSFILAKVARSVGMIGDEVFTATIAASLLSILLNVFIVRGAFGWVDRKLGVPGKAVLQEAA